MRYLVTGGSRFDPAIARDFYSFGIDVLNAYGLTETTGGAFLNPPGNIVFGSVGRASSRESKPKLSIRNRSKKARRQRVRLRSAARS
jgi:long-subunit acyl-CoA synthetase (AMP-forming)